MESYTPKYSNGRGVLKFSTVPHEAARQYVDFRNCHEQRIAKYRSQLISRLAFIDPSHPLISSAFLAQVRKKGHGPETLRFELDQKITEQYNRLFALATVVALRHPALQGEAAV